MELSRNTSRTSKEGFPSNALYISCVIESSEMHESPGRKPD